MEASQLILLLNIILSGIFLFAIYAKLFGVQGPKFIRWGFGSWFIYFTAAMEAAGIVGLYFPEFRIPAWMLLMTIMVGAFITLLRNQEPGPKFILPLSTFLLLISYFMIIRLS